MQVLHVNKCFDVLVKEDNQVYQDSCKNYKYYPFVSALYQWICIIKNIYVNVEVTLPRVTIARA